MGGHGGAGEGERSPLDHRLERISIRQLLDEAAAQPALAFLPFLGVDGYIQRGSSHLLAGYPRSGKTELIVQLALAWRRLGEQVLYVSEEAEHIWRYRVQRFDPAGDWTAADPDILPRR